MMPELGPTADQVLVEAGHQEGGCLVVDAPQAHEQTARPGLQETRDQAQIPVPGRAPAQCRPAGTQGHEVGGETELTGDICRRDQPIVDPRSPGSRSQRIRQTDSTEDQSRTFRPVIADERVGRQVNGVVLAKSVGSGDLQKSLFGRGTPTEPGRVRYELG